MANKVRETFKNPDYSAYTRECVRVGEALEGLGYELKSENYSQGEQVFRFSNGEHTIIVIIEGEGDGT